MQVSSIALALLFVPRLLSLPTTRTFPIGCSIALEQGRHRRQNGHDKRFDERLGRVLAFAFAFACALPPCDTTPIPPADAYMTLHSVIRARSPDVWLPSLIASSTFWSFVFSCFFLEAIDLILVGCIGVAAWLRSRASQIVRAKTYSPTSNVLLDTVARTTTTTSTILHPSRDLCGILSFLSTAVHDIPFHDVRSLSLSLAAVLPSRFPKWHRNHSLLLRPPMPPP